MLLRKKGNINIKYSEEILSAFHHDFTHDDDMTMWGLSIKKIVRGNEICLVTLNGLE
jgi:hypothetical protein